MLNLIIRTAKLCSLLFAFNKLVSNKNVATEFTKAGDCPGLTLKGTETHDSDLASTLKWERRNERTAIGSSRCVLQLFEKYFL